MYAGIGVGARGYGDGSFPKDFPYVGTDTMVSKLELYEALKPTLGADVARLLSDQLPDVDTFATKTELYAVEARLQAEIQDVRSDVALLRAELKADIADVKSELKSFVTMLLMPVWVGVFASLAAVALTLITRGG